MPRTTRPDWDYPDRRLAAAVGLSISAHVALAAWLAADPDEIATFAEAPQLSNPQHHERPDIRPGIDDGRSIAIAWLGFAEPTEHSAPVSRVEQAALTSAAGGLTAPAPEPMDPDIQSQSEPLPEESEQPQVQESLESEPALDAAPLPEPPREPVENPNEALPQPEAAPSEPTEAQQSDAEPTPTPGEASAPGVAPGNPSDRDSQPTALEQAVDIRPGQPLARDGIEVKTRFFPIWQSLLVRVRPQNPVIRLTFDARGRVKNAEFVIEEGIRYSTGSAELDETLLNGLYTWTATGRRIDELSGTDDTVSFVMRVLLR
ncbi:MAG: hypothetical protein AAGB51_02045 [Planctomycetota bacterium]